MEEKHLIILNLADGEMNVIETEIVGVKISELAVFGDEPRWFCETYKAERYQR